MIYYALNIGIFQQPSGTSPSSVIKGHFSGNPGSYVNLSDKGNAHNSSAGASGPHDSIRTHPSAAGDANKP